MQLRTNRVSVVPKIHPQCRLSPIDGKRSIFRRTLEHLPYAVVAVRPAVVELEEIMDPVDRRSDSDEMGNDPKPGKFFRLVVTAPLPRASSSSQSHKGLVCDS